MEKDNECDKSCGFLFMSPECKAHCPYDSDNENAESYRKERAEYYKRILGEDYK